MSLLNNLLPKKEKEEYFLTLGVEEHKISAAVALIKENRVTIIGTGESEFKEDDEIESADIAISTAEKNLPEGILVKKTIFALPPSFLEDDQIKEECLARLKKVTKELDLSPSGFIIYPEALVYYLKIKEESPPTLLLLSIARKNLVLSLVRVGNVEKNIVQERSTSISSDFEKLLTHFTSEILPSRIIIYDEVKGVQLEEIKEELLRLPWHKTTSFLHTPKIEILDENVILISLVEASAGSLTKELKLEEQQYDFTQKIDKKKEEKEENETFGFVREEILQEKETEIDDITPTINPTDPSFTPSSKMTFFRPIFNKLSPILLGLGLILSAIIIFSMVVLFYPKAQVNLIVYPITASQNIDVQFTTDENRVDINKNIFLAKKFAVDVTGEKTTNSTGKTKIGEHARGEVIIYNKTRENKTFPKGTILSNGQLRFTLTDDVNIASASETGEGLTFGKTSGNIEAQEIGTENNLPANNIFSLKDFAQTSFYAKNPNPFSGGTSREVSSISREDQNKLFESLSLELERKGREQVFSQVSSGEKLIDKIVKIEVANKKYDKEIGTEGKELNLSLSLRMNYFSFKENELMNLLKTDLLQIPTGYKLDENKKNLEMTDVIQEKNGDMTAKISLFVYFLPEIDTNQITSQILGKPFQDINQIASNIENVAGVSIIEETSLPFWNKRYPLKKENIRISILPH